MAQINPSRRIFQQTRNVLPAKQSFNLKHFNRKINSSDAKLSTVYYNLNLNNLHHTEQQFGTVKLITSL